MINCRALFINGPINSGKSTVAKLLSEQIKDSVFLEGDLVVAKADLNLQQWIVATIMTGSLKACELAHEGKMPIFAFPLREKDWKIINTVCGHAGVTPICVTLDPGEEICLSARGGRQLSADEKSRIKEMYQEGYHSRSFATLLVKNGTETPEQTCEQILSFVELPS